MIDRIREKVIFFGNGPLAEYALKIIGRECEVIFHARHKEDLEEVKRIKAAYPEARGILASFGVIIKPDVLELFEPEGILNIHPSLLPLYRGASPIESAILDGAVDFSVSVMKLVKAMDAGPVYYQTTLTGLEIAKKTGSELISGLIPSKMAIYQALAETGAEWLVSHLLRLPEPVLQDDAKATFCGKLTKEMGILEPEKDSAETILRKIVAFQGYPKSKFAFYGISCIILDAHALKEGETAVLALKGSDGVIIAVDRLQPEGRKAMDVKSFVNGYKR